MDPPKDAKIEAPDAKARLRGSVVHSHIDPDKPVTSENILRPQDRGFLASVLEAGKRAISIEVDAESGVSRLIWPGDHVDVVLTQQLDKDNPRRTASETILENVRIIAIDQEIEQGQRPPADNATGPGKPLNHPVSLELKPEDVQKIAVAKKLGTLSLTIRPDESSDAPVGAGVEGGNTRPTLSQNVSEVIDRQNKELARQNEEMARKRACEGARAIARENAKVRVYAGGKVKQYPVKYNDSVTCSPSEEAPIGPAAAPEVASPSVPREPGEPGTTVDRVPQAD
jgi:pilus assembly protein CpaB